MAYLTLIRNMIKNLRSANARQNFASGWNDRIQPIDQALLDRSRLWNDGGNIQTSIRMSNVAELEADAKADTRIEKKPVEVVNEILAEIPTFSSADLKKQIQVVQRRIKVLKEQGVRDSLDNEHHALGFLKARQLYGKNQQLFKWTTTNQDKVGSLLSKYKLHMVDMKVDGSGVTNIPEEAITEIEKYVAAYEKINKKDAPQFRLIVDEPTYQSMMAKAKKKDPILLALSPFGNWYYILGAWDKEILYIDDLIYNGK